MMMRHRRKLFQCALCLILLLSACGDGSDNPSGNGSIAFTIEWENPPRTLSDASAYLSADAGADVCADYGITTVTAKVFNIASKEIASGIWNCSDHQGTISNVPAGSGLEVLIEGNVLGTVKWRGIHAGITCTSRQTAYCGIIKMSYIGDDHTPPTIAAGEEEESVSPSQNATDVPVTTAVTVIFSEKMALSSINTSTFTIKRTTDGTSMNGNVSYGSSARTATFTPLSNLSYTTTYRVTITGGGGGVKDIADNVMTSNYSWSFQTECSPYEPPLPPTEVVTTSEDRQIIISWKPVSGATSYNIYWSTNIDQLISKTTGTKIPHVTSPYTHSGLTNDMPYYYVLTSENIYGEGNISVPPISGTPYCELPPVPGNVKATAGDGEIILDWDSFAGATSYNIYMHTLSGVSQTILY